jgi:hypothetical protein
LLALSDSTFQFKKRGTDIKLLSADKNAMIQKGLLVEATERFFAANAKAVDFDGTITDSRDAMAAKMRALLSGLVRVNAITLHHSASSGNISFAEFTFELEMKDGVTVRWHEVIRTVWEKGLVVEEQYFTSRKGLGAPVLTASPAEAVAMTANASPVAFPPGLP